MPQFAPMSYCLPDKQKTPTGSNRTRIESGNMLWFFFQIWKYVIFWFSNLEICCDFWFESGNVWFSGLQIWKYVVIFASNLEICDFVNQKITFKSGNMWNKCEIMNREKNRKLWKKCEKMWHFTWGQLWNVILMWHSTWGFLWNVILMWNSTWAAGQAPDSHISRPRFT